MQDKSGSNIDQSMKGNCSTVTVKAWKLLKRKIEKNIVTDAERKKDSSNHALPTVSKKKINLRKLKMA